MYIRQERHFSQLDVIAIGDFRGTGRSAPTENFLDTCLIAAPNAVTWCVGFHFQVEGLGEVVRVRSIGLSTVVA